MKAMILAGGYGTRISEETSLRPKPMVEIGGRPILWHIMRHYADHGINEFIICLGYKAEYVKKFFLDYATSLSDFTIDLAKNDVYMHHRRVEDWKITLLDTGLETMTGGRIKRGIKHLNDEAPFCLTYGDGLSNVDVSASIKFHKSHGKQATVTAVAPPGRFGVLDIQNDSEVVGFREKIVSDQYRINGGFFVLDPKVAEIIDDDETVWEQDPMQRLSASGDLRAWNHDGFWHPMDTLRDKIYLDNLWNSGNPPWRA